MLVCYDAPQRYEQRALPNAGWLEASAAHPHRSSLRADPPAPPLCPLCPLQGWIASLDAPVRFIFDGEAVSADETPAGLDLEGEEVIEVHFLR